LKTKKVCAWLTDEQKTEKVLRATPKLLLKQCPNYNSWSFANVVKGEEITKHGFIFMSQNKNAKQDIWATKSCKDHALQKGPSV
jgi:hypothetical protein